MKPLKKDFKKVRVYLCSGYGGSVIADIRNEGGETLARMDIQKLEEALGRRIRGGLFEFSSKGRKYQYITLK